MRGSKNETNQKTQYLHRDDGIFVKRKQNIILGTHYTLSLVPTTPYPSRGPSSTQ